MQQPERRYWVAIVRPHNLDALILKTSLQSYAASSGQAGRVQPGDRVALYQSRKTSGSVSGFVGIFEIIDEPMIDRNHAFSPLYQLRIPWLPMAVSLKKPLPLKPLVQQLRFITSKVNYGSALQRSWLRIPREDFQTIESALEKHVADTDALDPKSEIEQYTQDLIEQRQSASGEHT
jgi:predicted RNA-binding protein